MMSRVDKPELKCDRCGITTVDIHEMGAFQRIEHPHMSATESWDLCPECAGAFRAFLSAGSDHE